MKLYLLNIFILLLRINSLSIENNNILSDKKSNFLIERTNTILKSNNNEKSNSTFTNENQNLKSLKKNKKRTTYPSFSYLILNVTDMNYVITYLPKFDFNITSLIGTDLNNWITPFNKTNIQTTNFLTLYDINKSKNSINLAIPYQYISNEIKCESYNPEMKIIKFQMIEQDNNNKHEIVIKGTSKDNKYYFTPELAEDLTTELNKHSILISKKIKKLKEDVIIICKNIIDQKNKQIDFSKKVKELNDNTNNMVSLIDSKLEEKNKLELRISEKVSDITKTTEKFNQLIDNINNLKNQIDALDSNMKNSNNLSNTIDLRAKYDSGMNLLYSEIMPLGSVLSSDQIQNIKNEVSFQSTNTKEVRSNIIGLILNSIHIPEELDISDFIMPWQNGFNFRC